MFTAFNSVSVGNFRKAVNPDHIKTMKTFYSLVSSRGETLLNEKEKINTTLDIIGLYSQITEDM